MTEPLLRRASDGPRSGGSPAAVRRAAPLHSAPHADAPALRSILAVAPFVLAVPGLALLFGGARPVAAVLVLAGIAACGLAVPGRAWLAASLVSLTTALCAALLLTGFTPDLPYVLAGIPAALFLAAVTWMLRHHDLSRLEQARKDLAAAEAGTVLDKLTGLANRQGLLMLAAPMLEQARRNGDALHCIVMSVDGLSDVDTALGARARDDILVAAAGALRTVTRSTDVVARWEGNQFGVVGPGAGMSMTEVERRVREHLQANPPVSPDAWKPRVTAGGAVLAPWDEGNVDALLRKAHLETHARRAVRKTTTRRRTAGTA